MPGSLSAAWLGTRPYAEMVEEQRRLAEERRSGRTGDVLLLLEHPATYTRGRRTQPGDLPRPEAWYRERGIAVQDTPRGGRVTYHGPGQLVAYPIVDLRELPEGRRAVPAFVGALEQAIAGTLAGRGIAAGTVEGEPGVWVDAEEPIEATVEREAALPRIASGRLRKVGSIGLHISRGISTHGISINVAGDLSPFGWISPCGFASCEMSSIERESGDAPEVREVGEAFAAELAERLGLGLASLDPERLGFGTASLSSP